MNTIGEIPIKHASCISAFFKGAAIQFRRDETEQWTDTKDPNWHEALEYRIKPVLAVPDYPETRIEDLASIAYPSRDIKVPLLRNVANAAIRGAIIDGQVVPAGPGSAEDFLRFIGYVRAESNGEWISTRTGDYIEVFGDIRVSGQMPQVKQAVKQLERVNSLDENAANKAFDKRLELAEAVLVAAGYERFDVVGNWRKSDVVDASFDPDFQEVKDGANYRWMGHTAREWQEGSAAMERLAEFHANEADKYQRMLRATERNFESVQTGYTAAVQRYQAAESKIDDLHELAPRACRALCDYLGKTREEVSHEVIMAIVLLERSKP